MGLHFFSKTATATITTFCEHALRCAVQFEKATENSPPSECLFVCLWLAYQWFRVEPNIASSSFFVFVFVLFLCSSLAIPDTATATTTTTTTPLERLISYYDRVFSLTTLLYPQTFCVKHQACCEHYSYICKKVRGGEWFFFSFWEIN